MPALFLLAVSAQAYVANVSLTPSVGSGPSGSIQTFTAVYSDYPYVDQNGTPLGGATDISETDLDINTSAMAVAGCSIKYSDWSNGLYLANDNRTSWLGPLTPGSSATLQNSQCTLYGTGSSVSLSDTQLTMTVAVSFTAAFAGPKNTYLWAYDNEGDRMQLSRWGPGR